LSKLALNILLIPVILAKPERIFSATELILTDRRNKLSIKIIEALACLKSWYKLKKFILDNDLFIGPKIKDQE
jgi:hAT family C-terminal dimerisation region